MPCAVGFFQAAPGAETCDRCATAIGEGHTSRRGATSCERCLEDYFFFEPSEQCRSCPSGGLCLGDRQVPAPREGHWMDRERVKFSDVLYECPRTKACKGVRRSAAASGCWLPENLTAPQCSSDKLQCQAGSVGPLCGYVSVEL